MIGHGDSLRGDMCMYDWLWWFLREVTCVCFIGYGASPERWYVYVWLAMVIPLRHYMCMFVWLWWFPWEVICVFDWLWWFPWEVTYLCLIGYGDSSETLYVDVCLAMVIPWEVICAFDWLWWWWKRCDRHATSS